MAIYIYIYIISLQSNTAAADDAADDNHNELMTGHVCPTCFSPSVSEAP